MYHSFLGIIVLYENGIFYERRVNTIHWSNGSQRIPS